MTAADQAVPDVSRFAATRAQRLAELDRMFDRKVLAYLLNASASPAARAALAAKAITEHVHDTRHLWRTA